MLQKSKIERRQKSRESQCLDVSIAAGCDGAITKVPGRFLRNDMVLHVAKRGKHQRLLISAAAHSAGAGNSPGLAHLGCGFENCEPHAASGPSAA